MLCNYRNNMIGFIFQNYHLVEYMSVIDNIKLGQTIFNNRNNIDNNNPKITLTAHISKNSASTEKAFEIPFGYRRRRKTGAFGHCRLLPFGVLCKNI